MPRTSAFKPFLNIIPPPPKPSHVFETVEDDHDKEDKGALDAQIKAITDLLDSLKKQRGLGGGSWSKGSPAGGPGGTGAAADRPLPGGGT